MIVILVGHYGPWTESREGAEVWAVNSSYRKQPSPDRIYAMDALHTRHANFANDVNEIGCDVVMQRAYPEIPRCRAYDLQGAREFFGIDYYTSTVAYMMADAIREGAEKIILHHIICYEHSTEYYPQKACLDFWAGQAMGRGIRIAVSETSCVTKPLSWQSSLYGYEVNARKSPVMQLLASAQRGAMAIEPDFHWPDPVTKDLYHGHALH